MTRYTVVWSGDALDELAELWISARDRNAVSTAAHAIEAELSRDATTKGVEVAEGLRVCFSPPLRIFFTVDEGDRLVEVVRVRRR
jgi:plasmid stabilization system protein ParE